MLTPLPRLERTGSSVGCSPALLRPSPSGRRVGGVRIEPGDYLLADESGGVAIPASLAEQILKTAEEIHAVEEGICDLVLREGVSLSEARRRLGYHGLTGPRGAREDRDS